MAESGNKKALLNRRADAVARLVAPEGAASAFAFHLARVGRLAWASAQFQMCTDSNSGDLSAASLADGQGCESSDGHIYLRVSWPGGGDAAPVDVLRELTNMVATRYPNDNSPSAASPQITSL